MKDAYFFPHDSNATNDPKIMMLIAGEGLEGYGIYWTIIEHLREQPGYKSHLLILKALAMRYNSTEKKYVAVVQDFGLFVVDDDMIFFSPSLLKRMLPLKEKREKMKALAQKRWNKKADNEQINAHALQQDMQTQNESICKGNASKVKESKVKESKVKESKKINKKKYSDEIKYFTATLLPHFPENIIEKLTESEKWLWVDTIDKLVRLDNFSQDEITRAVEQGRNDNFWQQQFLSLSKLRKKNDDGVKYISVFLNLKQAESSTNPNAVEKAMQIYDEKYANK